MMNDKFLLMTTGGTIDGEWSSVKDTAINNGNMSHLPGYLGRIIGKDEFRDEFICNKDSRDIESGDNASIVKALTQRGIDRAIVTAGTYQMGMMEGFLRNHDSLGVLRHDLSILFTGATVPIHGYTFSDAGFNMGAALCALKNEEIGISGICMNGSLIRNGEGGKDVSLSQFRAHHERHDIWQKLKKVDFVHTGGSIDFELNGLDGFIPSQDSSVPAFMERVNVRQELSHYRLPNLKDSKLMTPEDRNTIIDLLKSSTSDKVIVTIGTFGMQEAYECARRANVPDKTIIFTGSSLPLAGVEKTDAPFQLGYAFALLNYLNPGVFSTFNGKVGQPTDILPMPLQLKKKK